MFAVIMPKFRDLTIKSLGFAAPVVQLELQQNEVESRYPRLSVVWVLEFSLSSLMCLQ